MKRLISIFLTFALLLGIGFAMGQEANAQTTAPVAENQEVKTYRNSSVGGRLSAHDPEGGALKFFVTTEPVKGSLELKEDGSFVYTPEEGKKGRDYFGYKVSDSEGNISQEATVIIRIEKQSKDVVYWDMKGSADEYNALLLCERDIFTGECVGGKYCFAPDKELSRGEFLSLCMQLSDIGAQEVLKTGYADDDDIPLWMKPYAASAAMSGVYTGIADERGSCFLAHEPISRSEAAMLLDRALNISRAGNTSPGTGDTARACISLNALGVLESPALSSDLVTRAEMAAMLAAALDILE